jgi:hypothetical protein
MIRTGDRAIRACVGYLNFTVITVEVWQLGHSKVRQS